MKTINLKLFIILLGMITNDVLSQNLNYSTTLNRNFATATFDITLQPDGFKQFEYLRAFSTANGIFSKVKIPYSSVSQYEQLNFVSYEIDSIELVFKDFGGNINWNKIEIRIDEYVDRPIIIGDYITSATSLADGWQKLTIPIYDSNFESTLLEAVRYLQFPLSRDAGDINLGIKSIRLKAANNTIDWLGSEKFDNSISSSNGMGFQLLLSEAEATKLVSSGIREIASGLSIHKTEMPFLQYQKSLSAGKQAYLAFVIDDLGNTYYSDTINVDIQRGLTYNKTDVSCAGATDGTIEVIMYGGTPPFSYSWSNGFSGATQSGLAQGHYQIKVTDALGQQDSISAEVSEPPQLSATVINQECASEGDYLVNITGGTAPYSFKEGEGDFQLLAGDSINNLAQFVSSKQEDLEFEAIEAFNDNSLAVVCTTTDTLRIDDVVISPVGGQFIIKISANGQTEWTYRIINGHFKEMVKSFNDDVIVGFGSQNQNLSLIDGNGMVQSVPTGHDLLTLSKEGIVHHSMNTQSNNMMDFEIDQWGNMMVLDAKINGITIRKLNQIGDEIWGKSMEGDFDSYRKPELAINKDGDIALIASFNNNITVDGYLIESSSKTQALVLKMNDQGVINWINSIGNLASSSYGNQVEIDDQGDLYVGVGIGIRDSLNIQKYDGSTGALIWSTTLSRYWFSGISELKLSNNNHVYVSGLSYEENLLFDSDEFQLRDYLIELDEQGDFVSYRHIFNIPYNFYRRLPFTFTNSGYLIYNTLVSPNTLEGFWDRAGNIVSEGPNATFMLSSDSKYFSIMDKNGCELEQSLELHTLPQPEVCFISIEENYPVVYVENLPDDITVDIFREGEALNQYDLVASEIPVNNNLVYLDSAINTLNRSFRYKVQLNNSCGNESPYSDFHQTIHLMLSEGIVDNHVNLQWNEYIGKSYNSVNIYKGSTPESLSLLTTLPANLYTYTDTDAAASDLYYKLELVGAEGCDQLNSSKAFSIRQAENEVKISSNLARRGLQIGNNAIAYPNPVKVGSLLYLGNSDPVTVRISNVSGVNIYTRKVSAQAGIPTSALKPGVYIVNYELNGLNVNNKIIVTD